MDARAGLDAVETRKLSFPCRESNSDCPDRSPSVYRLSYPGSLTNFEATVWARSVSRCIQICYSVTGRCFMRQRNILRMCVKRSESFGAVRHAMLSPCYLDPV
jgi:hypothetical protein